jgi:hypothetical protein
VALEAERTSDVADPRILETVGLAYRHAGEPEKAAKYQRRALALLPDGSFLARTRLALAPASPDASLSDIRK